MRAPLAAALLLLAACDFDPRGRCDSDLECLEGQICAGGVCAAPEAGPVNQAPVAVADAYPVTAGKLDQGAAQGLLANDADPDGDPLVAAIEQDPAHGVAYVEPDGAFLYVPLVGYTGEDSFTYRASDGALSSAPATVTLTVAP